MAPTKRKSKRARGEWLVKPGSAKLILVRTSNEADLELILSDLTAEERGEILAAAARLKIEQTAPTSDAPGAQPND